jgi:tetratricopeptide (TPR) repeat protein
MVNTTHLRAATALTLATGAALLAPVVQAACPALEDFYPQDEQLWPATLQALRPLETECLQSAEYFALLGAGQLNVGSLVPALESLERALLLDPQNGAAQVDYAEALYLSGQIFPALELNDDILQRSDVPEHLAAMIQARQQAWRRQTRRRGFVTEIGLGYDNNLNSGPARNEITLTLSGEPIQLALDQAFQPVAAPYSNLRLTGVFQQISPEHTHDLMAAVHSRNSEHSASDLLQFDWRYNLGSDWNTWRTNLTAGTSHLLWGGSPLYSVTEARFQLQPRRSGCVPQYQLAAQHQLYPGQSLFSGVESSASVGFECRPDGQDRRYGVELGLLNNSALDSDRPGGERQGWKLRVSLEQPLLRGTVSAQFSLASLHDASGFNELLADFARRDVTTRLFRLQYRQALRPRLELMLNLNRQQQGSNLGPFQNAGTAFELGLSYALGEI